jgi:hypothetical protein
MKSVKRLFAAALVLGAFASCGGHGLCDAYGYMEYNKQKKEQQSITVDETHAENGTI